MQQNSLPFSELDHVHSILYTVRMTEARTLQRAAPKQEPEASRQFPVLPQTFYASSFLSDAVENGHIVWKTTLWIARSSGIAGMAVENGPENLSKVPEKPSGSLTPEESLQVSALCLIRRDYHFLPWNVHWLIESWLFQNSLGPLVS